MQSGLPEGYWRGKRVLELGAGTGFTCLVAAVLGARLVVVSDGNPRVLQLASDNAAANLRAGERAAMEYSLLRWESAGDPSWKFEKGDAFDVILAADVTYSPDLVALLTQVISLVSARNPTLGTRNPTPV